MTTTILLNPAAGHGHAARLRGHISERAGFHWRDVELLESTAPGMAVELVRRAVERGTERVIAVGGDGTVHEVANGILASGLERLPPLGIVPAGTGNDYAKLLGCDRFSPDQAISHIARGATRFLDVGSAWDEYFINAVGIGLDAEVAARVTRYKHLRGRTAYLMAVAHALAHPRAMRLEVTSDTLALHEPLMLIEIGIGPVVGGGFRLTPDARADDGWFDICAIRQLSRLGMLWRLPLAIPGWHTRLRPVRMFQARHVRVVSEDGPMLAHADGEVRSGRTEMDIRILPARLPVLVPGARPSAQWSTSEASVTAGPGAV